MEISKNNVDFNAWNKLLENNPFSTPFQTRSFYDLCNNVPGYTANIYSVTEKRELLALCVVIIMKEKGIKGYFSRRAIVFGGPLIKINSSEVFSFLVNGINADLKNRVIYTEIRNYLDYKFFNSDYVNAGFNYVSYFDFKLPLEDRTLENIISSMQYNRRREINQTLKEGVTYHECNSIEEVHDLYNILHDLYKTRVKLPLPSIIFFEQLFYNQLGKVFIVKYENEIIGGSFCLFLPSHSIYTIYYCGIRNYKPKIFPTHIAILASIKFSLTNKIKVLDFMGAGKPGKEYGVREYKEKFGGELVENGRYIRINNPLLYQLGKLGLYINSKLKT